jgi:hypothetical protein
VVSQAVLASLRAAYPDDVDYFEPADLAIILNAATAWMGSELPGSFMCLAGPEFAEQENWEERVLLYVTGAKTNLEYYGKD